MDIFLCSVLISLVLVNLVLCARNDMLCILVVHCCFLNVSMWTNQHAISRAEKQQRILCEWQATFRCITSLPLSSITLQLLAATLALV